MDPKSKNVFALQNSSPKVGDFILKTVVEKFLNKAQNVIQTYATEEPGENKADDVTSLIHTNVLNLQAEELDEEDRKRDMTFEQVFSSLLQLSKHNLEGSLEFILDWCKNFDFNCPEVLKKKLTEMYQKAKKTTKKDFLVQYSERAEVAVDFLFSFFVCQLLSKCIAEISLMNISIFERIEEKCFEFIQKYSKLPVLVISARREVADLFAEILGILSLRRFQEIQDKFFQLISACKHDVVSIVHCMKYLRIQIDTTSNISKSAKFLVQVNSILMSTGGKSHDLKLAMYETMANILAGLASYDFSKGIEYKEWNEQITLGMKNIKSKIKPKYYMGMLPFLTMALCIRYDEAQQQEFFAFLMDYLQKLLTGKEKPLRLMVIDCLIHLMGFYLKLVDSLENEKLKDDVNDKLQKTITLLLSLGKKKEPNPNNIDQYESIVDFIMMVSNIRLEVALVGLIMELLKDASVSENALIGIRAFTAIAENLDLETKGSSFLEVPDAVKRSVKHPSWMVRLLLKKQQKGFGMTMKSDLEMETLNTMRFFSPYTNAQTSKTAAFQNKFKQMSIYDFEDEISKLFSVLLKELDKQFGNYTVLSTVKSLTEFSSKDRMFGLTLYSAAIGCMTQLLPNGYSPVEFAELLTRCTIHQHKEVKEASFHVIANTLKYLEPLRPYLLSAFVDLVYQAMDNKIVLPEILFRMVTLLTQWRDALLAKKAIKSSTSKTKESPCFPTNSEMVPTIYGKLQNVRDKFDLFKMEGLCLVLLCNTNEKVRVYGLNLIGLGRQVATELMESRDLDPVPNTLRDTLDEFERSIIKRMEYRCGKRQKLFMKFKDLNDLVINLEKTGYPSFLKEVAKIVSDYHPGPLKLALPVILKKIIFISNAEQSKAAELIPEENFEYWKNLIAFACAASYFQQGQQQQGSGVVSSVGGTTVIVAGTADIISKPKSSSNNSIFENQPKELFDLLLCNLRGTSETQIYAAIAALGSVHENHLETLLDRMEDYEIEAYSGDKKKRAAKKRNELLRLYIARLYVRICEGDCFQTKDHVKENILAFVLEQLQYLKLPACFVLMELQSLRYNFFIIVSYLARVLYYYPVGSDPSKCFDTRLREEIIRYAMQWSGFGEESRKREIQEAAAADVFIKGLNLRTDEDRSQYEDTYKKNVVKIQEFACICIQSLMLGKFFDLHKLDEIRHAFNSQKIRLVQIRSSNVNRKSAEVSLNSVDNVKRQVNNVLIPSSINGNGNSNSLDSKNVVSGFTLFKRSNVGTSNSFGVSVPSTPMPVDNLQKKDNLLNATMGGKTSDVLSVPPTSRETFFGEQILSWIDMVLCSSNTHRTSAIHCVANILQTNFEMFEFCLDQCYHVNTNVSTGYFISIATVMEEFLIPATPPQIFTVVLYFLRSHAKELRNMALHLLNLYSLRAFPFDDDTGNYPYYYSADQPDVYVNVEQKISLKLSKDHPQFTLEMFKEVYSRLPFVPELQQASLFCTLTYWAENLHMNNLNKETDREAMAALLFDLTDQFGDAFLEEIGLLWRTIAKEPSNVLQMLNFLSSKCSLENVPLLHVGQKICKHCVMVQPETVFKWILAEFEKLKVLGISSTSTNNTQQQQKLDDRRVSQYDDIQYNCGEIALNFLCPIAYDRDTSETLPQKLPFVIHNLILMMDNASLIVSENAKQCLIHLIHAYVLQKFPSNGTTNARQLQHLYEAKETIHFLMESNPSSQLWKNDTDEQLPSIATTTSGSQPSFKIISRLVKGLLKVFSLEPEFRLRWGAEAFNYAVASIHFHSIVRSLQVFRVIKEPLQFSDVYLIAKLIRQSFIEIELIVPSEVTDQQQQQQQQSLTSNVALSLMSLILEKFDDYDMSLQNVIIAQRIQSSERQYQGLLPLVLKGLYHERSHDDAIHLISHMVVIPGDYLFHHHTSVRLAVNIFGLLPFMCTHIRDAQQEECFQMARNISMACENTKLPKIAKVFIRYANGHYGQADSFLIDLKKPFVDTIFRQSEDEIYTLIQNLLEYGPSSYVKALLEITYSLLPTELSKSLLLQRENFGYVSTITSILEQPLWADANRVLDVLVRSSITGTKVRLNSTAVGNQQRRSKMSNSEFFQQQSGGDKNVIDLLSVLVKEKPNIQEKRRDSSKEATSADGDASSDEFTEDSTETMTETNDDGTTTFRTSSNEKEETLLKQFNDFLAKALKTGNPN